MILDLEQHKSFLVYKFRSLSGDAFKRTNRILVKNRIWFSMIHALNDMFEGEIKSFSEFDIASINNLFRKRKKIAPKDIDLRSTRYFTKNLDEQISNRIKHIKGNTAILSLTRSAQSPALWGHYADSGKGIAIEY